MSSLHIILKSIFTWFRIVFTCVAYLGQDGLWETVVLWIWYIKFSLPLASSYLFDVLKNPLLCHLLQPSWTLTRPGILLKIFWFSSFLRDIFCPCVSILMNIGWLVSILSNCQQMDNKCYNIIQLTIKKYS